MANEIFKHCDPDDCHGRTLTLHDCVAERICYSNGILRFYLPDGLWITPNHAENSLDKTVRTDAAIAEFRIEDINDITVRVFTRGAFGKTKAEIWEMSDLMDAINSGKCWFVFIYQYRAYFEQMWSCAIRSKRKPDYRECQLHLPGTSAVFRWNELRPDCEW